MKWTALETAQDVAEAACQRITTAASDAITARGSFTIVLAGGTTPAQVYKLLAASNQDWPHWHIFVGDERCLPEGDADRNSSMIEHSLLNSTTIPAGQIHMIPAHLGPEQATQQYAETITPYLPFDMVLLGMGEDGHTASLFPGHHHPEDALVVPVHHAPKPPADRVSMSARALGSCRQLIILVTGASKQDAIARWQQGDSLPVNRITTSSSTEVLVDGQAWGQA
jgi:6-phosphogluconolactonase